MSSYEFCYIDIFFKSEIYEAVLFDISSHALRDELSWTHYRLLMKVESDNAREFYMREAIKSQWSTRQLARQIDSFFYERLLSSKNKEQVAAEIQTLEPAKKPEDIIRGSYVLEFLGLNSNHDFYENDLEQALEAGKAGKENIEEMEED